MAVGCCNLFTAYRKEVAFCHELVRLTYRCLRQRCCYLFAEGHRFMRVVERAILRSIDDPGAGTVKKLLSAMSVSGSRIDASGAAFCHELVRLTYWRSIGDLLAIYWRSLLAI